MTDQIEFAGVQFPEGPDDKVLDILRVAAELVSGGWLQKYMARDARGRTCSWMDDAACSFCLVGALHCAAKKVLTRVDVLHLLYVGPSQDAYNLIYAEVGKDLVDFNDDHRRTVSEVLVALAGAYGTRLGQLQTRVASGASGSPA